MGDAIAIVRIDVHADRIGLLLRWPADAPRDTDEEECERLRAAVLERYPDLPSHHCVNERGERFGDVMAATPLPHLLEHLIISEVTRDARTPRTASIYGTSQWTDECDGLARIELVLTDDLVVLGAVKRALAFLNEALGVGPEKPLPPMPEHC